MKANRLPSLLFVVSLCVLALLCFPLVLASPVMAISSGVAVAGLGMLFTPFHICEPADEHASGGGSGDDVSADVAPVTIGDRLKAAVQSKAALVAKISAHESTIAAHESTISDLTAKLSAVEKERDALKATVQDVEQSLKASEDEAAALKAEASTVEKKAQEKVAALGFPASSLPAATDASSKDDDIPSTKEQLEERIASLPKMQDRIDLLQKFKAAQKQQAANG